MIETKNLSKIYNPGKFEVKAVNNISTFFEEGEFTSVVGPSGSGKTTFLNCVGGLDQPTSGEVIISGENITKLSGSKIINYRLNNIGFVFQAYNLIPVLSAKENIEMIMLLQGVDENNRISRTNELLNQVGLYEMRDRRPSQLSGGQQQRVAIARALAMRPKVMLLDEITSALDPEVVGEVLNVIRSLNKEHSLTMIMVTHQMGFAREISDRVCFFNEGKIFEQGPPEKLFGDPQNERTKQFLHAVLDAN